jgi:ethanolamine permease
VHPKFRTPANALIFNMLVGIIALMTGKTGEIITIACFGALALYIISMVSFFFLRKNEPDMERPFRVPFYPLFPALALSIATFSIIAMAWYNAGIALVFLGIMGLSFVGYLLFIRGKSFGENGNE